MFNDPFVGRILIQAIGVLALVFSLSVFQANKRNHMLKLHIGASVFYAMHYFLLGGLTGAAIKLINIIRDYTFFKIKKRKHTWFIPMVFITCFTVVGILSWNDSLSILPILSATSGTLAFWQRSPKLIRLFSLMVSPLWFIYAAFMGSYPGMVAEFIMFSSDVVGLYRFNFCHKLNYRRLFKKKRKLRVR